MKHLPNYAALLLLSGTIGFAQLAPATKEQSSGEKPAGIKRSDVTAAEPAVKSLEPETIELSPFVVNAEQDTGYQAQSTLAGSRLNTPLKDIGAAISVYTKDFMNDIGAVNANDLLVFATSMEIGGSQGNYSGTGAGVGDIEVVGDGPRTNPQGSSRSRGLNAPTFTRNYFKTNISLDGYNTGSVTVNRGPNSILFGIGSPSGVVDNTLVTADLGKDRNKFEFRYGDNNSQRYVLDLNRVLIPKKLGLRVVGMQDNEEFDQRPAYDHKKRLFGTSTFKPFRSTTISANFETGSDRANRPITVLPYDSISKFWYQAGRPAFDWTFYDDPARNPLAASQNVATFRPGYIGQGQIFGGLVIPYDNRTPNGGPGLGFRSAVNSTTSTTNPAINSYRSFLPESAINKDLANDTIQWWETFNYGETAKMAAALYGYTAPDGIVKAPAGIKMQAFTNYDSFDFNKRQIDETSLQTEDFHNFNMSISQTAWKDKSGVDKVGVELAYNKEYFTRYSNNAFFSQGNGNHIRLDLNVTLPDGKPNPNVGRAYVMGASAAQLNWFEGKKENRRATAFLRHDFRDNSKRWGKWLGKHTLTGLYEEAEEQNISSSTKLRLTGEAADAIGAGLTNFNRLPNAIVYVSDSILDGSQLKLYPIRIIPLAGGTTTNTRWFKAPAGLVNGVATQGSFVETNTNITEFINSANPSMSVIESNAYILQSSWLDDHLITVAGWRSDKSFSQTGPNISITTPGYAERKRVYLSEIDFPGKPPFTAEGETKSFSAVLRWPKKLVRLPRGMDLSFFVSKSENFDVSPGRLTFELQPITNPSGDTKEFGLSVSFFDDKLNFRVNRFETSQVNATRGGTYSLFANYYTQLAGFWVSQENTVNTTTGVAYSRRADVEELLNALPTVKAYINPVITGSGAAGNAGLTFTPMPSVTDTQDFVSKGTELELIYNPTRQWRIALNFANQETVLSNLAPGAKSTFNKLYPVWQKYWQTPRAASATWIPGVPFDSTNTDQVGNIVTRELIIPYYTLLAQEGVASSEQRKYRVNLVTNYQFGRTGFLNGFGVGSGVRWQSKYALGYPTTFKADGSVFIDIANPYWSDDDWNVDTWVSYSRKIYRDKINWKMQLNFRNVLGSSDPIAITVQPDGSPAATRIPPEKRIFLTSTFEF